MGIEEALADCLEKVESGELTPEEALRGYPALKEELEPLLLLAIELHSLPKVVAPESLRSYKRPVFRGRVAACTKPAWRRWFGSPALPSFGWASSLAQAAAALAVVLLLAGSTVVASASSLPEEPLYPVKLAIENAQLALAPDSARAELEMQLAARRLEEVVRAAREGKTDSVQRGLALYQERVDSALSSARAASSPSAAGDVQQIEESLKHNVQVLEDVQSKVGSQQASAAIQRAIERTEERAQTAKESMKGPEPATSAAAPAATTPASTPPTSEGASALGGDHDVPREAGPHQEEVPGRGKGSGKMEEQPQGQAQGQEQQQEEDQGRKPRDPGVREPRPDRGNQGAEQSAVGSTGHQGQANGQESASRPPALQVATIPAQRSAGAAAPTTGVETATPVPRTQPPGSDTTTSNGRGRSDRGDDHGPTQSPETKKTAPEGGSNSPDAAPRDAESPKSTYENVYQQALSLLSRLFPSIHGKK